jgi:hypothetical protein
MLGEEIKLEKQMQLRFGRKLKKAGPSQGAAVAEFEGVEFGHVKVRETYNDSQCYKKERPKSAFHDKFARPSTGKHSLHNK